MWPKELLEEEEFWTVLADVASDSAGFGDKVSEAIKAHDYFAYREAIRSLTEHVNSMNYAGVAWTSARQDAGLDVGNVRVEVKSDEHGISEARVVEEGKHAS